jgi:hypothetical protein
MMKVHLHEVINYHMVITLQLFFEGEPYDFNDENWCANLNMWAS